MTEVGSKSWAAETANDFAVTTSQNIWLSSDGQKNPRRPYRRRSVKAIVKLSESSNSAHVGSTETCVSPVVIKQETVDCDTSELLDQLATELVHDFSSCQQQRLTEDHSEHTVDSCNLDLLPVGDPQTIASGSGLPTLGSSASQPDPVLSVSQHDCVNTALPAPASIQSPQPQYEDVVKSMQRAYYDLLPILHRVGDALGDFIFRVNQMDYPKLA